MNELRELLDQCPEDDTHHNVGSMALGELELACWVVETEDQIAANYMAGRLHVQKTKFTVEWQGNDATFSYGDVAAFQVGGEKSGASELFSAVTHRVSVDAGSKAHWDKNIGPPNPFWVYIVMGPTEGWLFMMDKQESVAWDKQPLPEHLAASIRSQG